MPDLEIVFFCDDEQQAKKNVWKVNHAKHK
jgi:hypothetical protein